MKSRLLKPMPTWQKNMYLLWVGVFLAGVGLSMVTPFLSLYIGALGTFTKSQLSFYSSLAFSGSYFVMAIVSPLWGRLADTKGRKKMIIRAGLGMSIVFFLMGLVNNVWQLIALRVLQGALGGFTSNSNALVASETPAEQSGYSMGIMMTGMTSGTLLGPLFGGLLADTIGFRVTFILTGSLLMLATLLVIFGVHEVFKPAGHVKPLSRSDAFDKLAHPKMMWGFFLTTMLVMVVNQSINPILALFVQELNHNGQNTAFWAGIVAAVPGIATLLFAPTLGRLGDHYGTARMISLGFLFASLVFLPMSLVQTISQLIMLRFLIGVSDATMLPAIQSLITKEAPHEIVSRMFAYNQSFQSLGSVFGPLLGALTAHYFDYRGVFVVSAVLMVLNGLWFWYNTRTMRESDAGHAA